MQNQIVRADHHGWGLNAAFSREKNQLRSGLSQSLFVSGFGAARPDFGWQIGGSPFDDLITPGRRTVNAIILVPKGMNKKSLEFTARYCWPKRQDRYERRWSVLRVLDAPPQALFGMPPADFGPWDEQSCVGNDNITMTLPQEPRLTIKRITYNPMTLKETPGTQISTSPTEKTNTVQISFNDPVDPNLTITVADKLINRVRDVRRRALFGDTTRNWRAPATKGNFSRSRDLESSRRRTRQN